MFWPRISCLADNAALWVCHASCANGLPARLPRRGFILQPRVARRRRATLGLRLRELAVTGGFPTPTGLKRTARAHGFNPVGVGEDSVGLLSQGSREDAATLGWRMRPCWS